jgi:hypothetical protein
MWGDEGSPEALKAVQFTFLFGETTALLESTIKLPLSSTALNIISTGFYGLLTLVGCISCILD